MKYLKEYLIPSCIIIISILSMIFFRTIPSSKLWDDYSVVYVQKNVDESLIQKLFDDYGCKDVISGAEQFVPMEFSSESPEISMAIAKVDSSNYLVRRNLYFFDKNSNYKIYYVPDEYKNNLEDVIFSLQEEGFKCGVDVSASYPIFLPILCVIFAIFLIIKSPMKKLFASSCVLPVIFSFFIPFYPSVAAACLLLLSFYFALYLWGRNGAIGVILKNPIFLIFFVGAIIVSFFAGIKNFLIFIIMICGNICVLHFYKIICSLYQKRFSFVPVKIRSASFVSVVNSVSLLSTLICGVVIAGILVSSFFSINIGSSIKNSEQKVLLPASYGNGALPNLNDYIFWKWNSMTEPYISVYDKQKKSNPKEGDSVSFTEYIETNEGIKESVKTIVFSSEFEENAFAIIDKLPYPSIEKLMKAQKKNFSAGYVFSGSQNVSIFTIIQLICAMFIPIIVYLFCSKDKLIKKI